jgi:hypothetical protein
MSLANEKSWYCTRVLLFILTKMWKKLIDIKGKVCKRKHMQLQQHSNKIHSKIVATTHFMDQIEILRHPSNHDCPRTTETLEIKNPVSLKFFFFFFKELHTPFRKVFLILPVVSSLGQTFHSRFAWVLFFFFFFFLFSFFCVCLIVSWHLLRLLNSSIQTISCKKD